MPVGLLTPVPIQHLRSGAEVCDAHGAVAFGTRACDVFQRLDSLGGTGAQVLIYASWTEEPRPVASWIATYVGWEHAQGNGVPSRRLRRVRPPTCLEEDQEAGYWYAFYEVTELRELEGEIPIGHLKSWAKEQPFLPFTPEGPIPIET